MKNKYNEKIAKIKKEHAELVNIAHENILKSNESFNENLSQVVETLNLDAKYVTKYTAIVKVQDLIANLTEQIINTNDKDEIIKLRRKLNNYIRKVKEELAKRNMPQTVIEKFQAKTNYLRKDIARLIRYLKREDNIKLINELYSNYDNLSPEELELLKKSLAKENTYNLRNKKELATISFKKEIPPTNSIAQEKLEESKLVFTKNLDDNPAETKKVDYVFAESVEDNNDTKPNNFDFQSFVESNDLDNLKTNQLFTDKKTYIADRIVELTKSYNLKDTLDYQTQSFTHNIITFFHNLPTYIHNKKCIKVMKNDYYLYYRGKDFNSFIKYSQKRNSIISSLRCIFNQSYLYSNDLIYLNKHKNCFTWIYNSFINDSKLTLVKQ